MRVPRMTGVPRSISGSSMTSLCACLNCLKVSSGKRRFAIHALNLNSSLHLTRSGRSPGARSNQKAIDPAKSTHFRRLRDNQYENPVLSFWRSAADLNSVLLGSKSNSNVVLCHSCFALHTSSSFMYIVLVFGCVQGNPVSGSPIKTISPFEAMMK